MTNQETIYLTPFLNRMQPTLEATLARLARTKFREDPIGGAKYSRATSIISSAYKRHGQILGRALLERLKDCGRFNVWTEDSFKLSLASASELQRGLPPQSYRQVTLPYGDKDQVIPIDIIAYDTENKTIRSYNVKRGNGAYDAGKRRLLLSELLRTQMHLGEYARSVDINADSAESFVVFYYGLCSAPAPYSLVADGLDEHFKFPVVSALEAVNHEFRDRLYRLIECRPAET